VKQVWRSWAGKRGAGVTSAPRRRALRLGVAAGAGLVALTLGWLPGPGQAAPATAQAALPPLRVVLDDNYPPYIFRDEAGQLQGILKDAWDLWSTQTGRPVDLMGMDWAKAQALMQAGGADVIDTMFETPERDRVYDFGAGYNDIEVAIYFHESVSGINKVATLKGFKVGAKAGDACIEYLRRHGIDTVRPYPSYEAVIDGAAAGEVRVFCMDRPPATYFLVRKGLAQQFRSTAPLYVGHFHRAVHKGRQGLIRQVEAGFAGLSPQQWREIEASWLGEPVDANGLLPYLRYARYAGYGAAGLAILILGLGAWNLSLRRRVAAHTRDLAQSLEALRCAKGELEGLLAHQQATLDAIPDLMFELDVQGRFLAFHSSRRDLLSMPPDAFMGRTVSEVMSAQAAPVILASLQEAASHGVSHGAQLQFVIDQQVRWFELSVSRKRMAEGQPDHFIVLSRDITDRKRAQEELARHGSELEQIVLERSQQLVGARDAAERASRAKSDFLSRMSHELRTPMNAILGFSQLMEMDPQISGKGREFTQEILRAGKHLLHLINDVLDLEQVESGRVTLNMQPVRLAPVGAEMVALMQPLASKQGLTMAQAELDDLVVWADELRLKQILLNLLSNAVKYNRPGGVVWLEARALDAQTVRIAVRDTGRGIAERHLSQLFQPFNRLGVEADGIEGSGIGLSLCRRLTSMMRGDMGVSSVEGEGSTFWVDLSRVCGPEDAHGAPSGAAITPGRSAAGDPSTSGPPAAAHARATSATLLYVEDNPANQELMSHIVSRHQGLMLLTASEGQLGLDLARAHTPDLVLLDIHLPDMDGYELLRRMREVPGLQATPVIAVSADAMPDDVARIEAAGFDAQVAKPIQVQVLDQLLQERLGTVLA